MSMGECPNDAQISLGNKPDMIKPVELLAIRLAERVSELGTNDHAASVKSGFPGIIREVKRGKMPAADRLARLAEVLETTSEWLLGSDDADRQVTPTVVSKPKREVAETPRSFNPLDLPKDVPVYAGAIGTALDFSDGVPVEAHLMDMHDVVDMARRPPGLAGSKGIYAIYIAGDSQSPRFESGEMVFVHPFRPVAPGDDIVVQLLDDDDFVNCALVKRLVRRGASEITLRQFNPPSEFTVPNSRVRAMHKILNNSELWGY